MKIVNDAKSWSITPGSSITLLGSSISGPLCSERTSIAQASLMREKKAKESLEKSFMSSAL